FSSPLHPREINVEPVEPATLEETERETIRRSLERNGGRRKATAAELNISERTLYRKIKEYGIE
ncbi:MAG: sigma-54-dependent Fis family transcriptional regulator, partial [Duncaniella sp.]|nr:sigma-54-dependent Fis family transcriptional regulator [Duncaniella sp.]